MHSKPAAIERVWESGEGARGMGNCGRMGRWLSVFTHSLATRFESIKSLAAASPIDIDMDMDICHICASQRAV